MKLRKTAVLAGAVMLSLTMLSQAGAATQTDELQQQIDEVLANTTGGVQISRNEISWNGGEAIMAFPLPGEDVAPPSSDAAVQLQTKTAGVSTKSVAAEAAAGEALAADDGCPTEVFGNDWYCFYQFENYGGRRLQWNASHKHGDMIFFSVYDFDNKTSSWSNKGGKYIYVEGRSQTGMDRSCFENAIHLWQEAPHTKKAYVGSSLDNKADCFWTS
ncbi:peptidase inhibitor family I36 protein [Streptomyces sp. AC555_RSS877]|uniref:peptidase inhibitor family I36 protein n=1 Tax=Streptomyces sp. AC555_RSS877 TaxID=2823688 RepID=UPI001C269282|nr:peptidase inhibitor family I36 protein [Streptomyces sp. AC555_RSS877]